VITLYEFKKVACITPLASVFDESVSADEDILDSDLELTLNGILRVTVALDTAAAFKLKLTRGGTTKVLSYNGGNSLTTDALYVFDVPVRSGDKVNFRAGSACVAHLLSADFVAAMGP